MRGFRKLTKNDAIENISDKKESDRNMKKYQIMAKRTSKSVSCFLYILVQIHSVNFNSLNIGKKRKKQRQMQTEIRLSRLQARFHTANR